MTLVVVLTSCQGKKKSPEQLIVDYANNKYIEIKSFFPKNLTQHFPNVRSINNITFVETISPLLGTSLEFIVVDSIQLDSLIVLQSKLENQSLGRYSSSDSCLLVVNRYITSENNYSPDTLNNKLLIERPCYESLLPVPNFWQFKFTNNETECRLPVGYSLYVIEAEPGKFVEEKLLTNGWFMPEKWKHGYSRGIALNMESKILIYWLDIW